MLAKYVSEFNLSQKLASAAQDLYLKFINSKNQPISLDVSFFTF
jgi:hypothetical protein